MNDEDNFLDAISANLKWLDFLGWAMLLFSVSSIVAKLTGVSEVEIASVRLNPDYSIFVLAASTGVHVYVAINLVHSIGQARFLVSPVKRSSFYQKCISQGGILTRGTMDLRGEFVTPVARNTVQLKTSAENPCVSVHYLLAILTFLMSVPFDLSWGSVMSLAVATSLVQVNFGIGASWFVALADFGRESGESMYFTSEEGKIRTRAIPISGPVPYYLGVEIDRKNYFFAVIMETLLLSIILGFLASLIWIVVRVISLTVMT